MISFGRRLAIGSHFLIAVGAGHFHYGEATQEKSVVTEGWETNKTPIQEEVRKLTLRSILIECIISLLNTTLQSIMNAKLSQYRF